MSQVLPFHFLLLRRIKGEYQAQDVTVTDFRSFLQPQWPTNQWYQCAQNCNTMYGIRETTLSWIKNYLEDRTQFVQFSSSWSYQRIISCGVPQSLDLSDNYLPLRYVSSLTQSLLVFTLCRWYKFFCSKGIPTIVFLLNLQKYLLG